MTIMELPGRARASVRATNNGLVSRFLQPMLFSRRRAHGGGRHLPPPALRRLDSNGPLESLAGGTLASRFHAWQGASGQRYICSVFPAQENEADAGLPDFADAIAIAVARGPDGRRRHLSIFLDESASDPRARQAFIVAGLAKGVIEWHVHLLTEGMTQRRAAARDIEACCSGAALAR